MSLYMSCWTWVWVRTRRFTWPPHPQSSVGTEKEVVDWESYPVRTLTTIMAIRNGMKIFPQDRREDDHTSTVHVSYSCSVMHTYSCSGKYLTTTTRPLNAERFSHYLKAKLSIGLTTLHLKSQLYLPEWALQHVCIKFSFLWRGHWLALTDKFPYTFIRLTKDGYCALIIDSLV